MYVISVYGVYGMLVYLYPVIYGINPPLLLTYSLARLLLMAMMLANYNGMNVPWLTKPQPCCCGGRTQFCCNVLVHPFSLLPSSLANDSL